MEANYDKGKWIEIARVSRNLTQKELTDRVDKLKQSNLSKMEKGLLRIPEKTLERIAEALNYPISFFKDPTVQTPLTYYYFRKRISMPKGDKDSLEVKFDILRRTIDCLLHNMDLPPVTIQTIEDEQMIPEEAANYTRGSLKLGNGPIENIFGVLEKNGIIIYELNGVSDKFDGLTLKTDRGHYLIFLNKNLSNDRKRFTLAHELGHFVLHFHAKLISQDRDVEKEANRFASEFLFPSSEAKRILGNLKISDLGIIKSQWLMSKAAIIYKARELDLISDDKKKYFMIELSRNGERKKERGTVQIDEPKIIKQSIDVYKELDYSINDLSIISKLNPDDFKDYFMESSSTLKVVWRKAI